MLGDAFNMIIQSLTFAIAQTDRLLSGIGDGASAVLAVFVIYTSYRFFLKPLLGGAGSDRARTRKKESDAE